MVAPMNIRKAIVPAAGLGTRMLPAAKAIPKEMLPILDRPTIQYVAQEAAEAGITDFLLITSREKRALEDHFDRQVELEARLKAAGREELIASVQALMQKMRFAAVRQGEQKGLGHAVLQAKAFVGDEPFACMLGDAVFSGGNAIARLIEVARQVNGPVVGLERVPMEKVSRYGVIGGSEISPGVFKIDRLVEKPRPQEAPSNLAIAARYVLVPEIFECIEQTAPGAGGEIQLTDALSRLMAMRPVHGVVIPARRHDIGNPVDWLLTNLHFAKQDAALWEKISPVIRELMQ